MDLDLDQTSDIVTEGTLRLQLGLSKCMSEETLYKFINSHEFANVLRGRLFLMKSSSILFDDELDLNGNDLLDLVSKYQGEIFKIMIIRKKMDAISVSRFFNSGYPVSVPRKTVAKSYESFASKDWIVLKEVNNISWIEKYEALLIKKNSVSEKLEEIRRKQSGLMRNRQDQADENRLERSMTVPPLKKYRNQALILCNIIIALIHSENTDLVKNKLIFNILENVGNFKKFLSFEDHNFK